MNTLILIEIKNEIKNCLRFLQTWRVVDEMKEDEGFEMVIC
jgi:hypothetical protein